MFGRWIGIILTLEHSGGRIHPRSIVHGMRALVGAFHTDKRRRLPVGLSS
jgi:hypothetical protein